MSHQEIYGMGKIVAGMTVSLDGFVNDAQGDVGRLYPDFEALVSSDNERMQESMRATGAVVMGKHAFEMGGPDSYADSYEYQVPIFVLTHHPPPKHPRENDKLTFTFVADGIESAIRGAKAAAGDKDVTLVGGASAFQQALNAGLVDEVQIDVMPVLLGEGLRLFEHLDTDRIQLERIDVEAMPSGRTFLQFRVVK
jgi:dihydrofolate reductase